MPDKVLIIDDDIDTLRLVGLMLQHQGYQILAASSGMQGIAKAEGEHPDVILLDVMMPDMDGYEVARRLRQHPRTRSTPILMFTAKTQLEDKVAGFEVGVDDYLTKPTSPAELQSHVRQLLEHAREREAAAAASQHGRAIAVLGSQDGLGVSTLAANLAASLRIRSSDAVILAELTLGQGTLGLDLGVSDGRALSQLLSLQPEQITPERVNAALVPHASGLRLLLASDDARQVALLGQTRQFEALFDCLVALASFVILDIGSRLPPWTEKILPLCQERIVVTEAVQYTIAHTRYLLDELTALGIDPAGIVVVLNNRVRYEAQLPWTMAQQGLGHPITATLSPAPELMAEASRRHLPAVLAVPQDVTSQQMVELASRMLPPETIE